MAKSVELTEAISGELAKRNFELVLAADIEGFLDTVASDTNGTWRQSRDVSVTIDLGTDDEASCVGKPFAICTGYRCGYRSYARGKVEPGNRITVSALEGGINAPDYRLDVDGVKVGMVPVTGMSTNDVMSSSPGWPAHSQPSIET